MKFGTCLTRLLQKIRESDPADGPIWISKYYIFDTFHRCNLLLSDIGKFTCIMPPLPAEPTVLICIYLVLPMGWVNPPDLLCSALDIVADNAKSYLLDPSSSFAVYPPHPPPCMGYTSPRMPRQPPPDASSTWTCTWTPSSTPPRGIPLSNRGSPISPSVP